MRRVLRPRVESADHSFAENGPPDRFPGARKPPGYLSKEEWGLMMLHTTAAGRRLAYDLIEGAGPTIVFLHGFRSDMEGTKALDLADWCGATRRGMLRFDLSGHGLSTEQGAVEDFGITVTERVPLTPHPNDHNLAYLLTKRDRMGHDLPGVAEWLAAHPGYEH